jgi:transposase
MKFYAAPDVSLAETSICIVDEAGTVVKEGKVASDPAAITAFLAATGLSFVRIGLEAGALSQRLHDGLARAGLPVVCLETRRLKAALSAMTHKTDRNDARGMAQVVRTGWFRAVHVKTGESRVLRALLAGRGLLVQKLMDTDNQIRGSLRAFGLKVGRVSKRGFERRVRELVAGRPLLLALLEPMLRVRAAIPTELTTMPRLVRRAARRDPVCRRLMTVPGVGPVVALTFRAAVDVPARCAKSKAVGAHFGLVPRRYQSGEVDRVGRISKVGDDRVRTMLYEAANTLLSRSTRWSALKAWAVRVAERRGLARAKVALARKLAVALHRIWVDGTEFRWGSGGDRPVAA